MTIRDDAREYISRKRPEWHDNGVGIVQGSHYRSGFVDGAEWALRGRQALNVERENAASAWVSENLHSLRDETTEDAAHDAFVSGAEWERDFK